MKRGRGRERLSQMSAFGVKRTCLFALHMSAYDPKQTYSTYPNACRSCCNRLSNLGVFTRRVCTRVWRTV